MQVKARELDPIEATERADRKDFWRQRGNGGPRPCSVKTFRIVELRVSVGPW